MAKVSEDVLNAVKEAHEKYLLQVLRSSLADFTKGLYRSHTEQFILWLEDKFQPGQGAQGPNLWKVPDDGTRILRFGRWFLTVRPTGHGDGEWEWEARAQFRYGPDEIVRGQESLAGLAQRKALEFAEAQSDW